MKITSNSRTSAKEKMIADLMEKYQLQYDDARLLFIKARYITRKYKAGMHDVSDIIMGVWAGNKHEAEQDGNSNPLYTFEEFMRLFMKEINKSGMKDVN